MHIYSASDINYESAVPIQAYRTIRGRNVGPGLEEWAMY